MDDQPQYSEKSGFPQWIFWLIAIIPASVLLYTRLAYPQEEEPFDLFGLIIAGGVALLLYVIKLKVNINAEGISYQFPPFHNKPNLLSWEIIESLELMKINPLKEFGGWGLRYGKLGTAYTTRGRYILHIKRHSGKPINLTIAKPENFIAAVTKQKWPVKPMLPEITIP
jgi:hypothetical protein